MAGSPSSGPVKSPLKKPAIVLGAVLALGAIGGGSWVYSNWASGENSRGSEPSNDTDDSSFDIGRFTQKAQEVRSRIPDVITNASIVQHGLNVAQQKLTRDNAALLHACLEERNLGQKGVSFDTVTAFGNYAFGDEKKALNSDYKNIVYVNHADNIGSAGAVHMMVDGDRPDYFTVGSSSLPQSTALDGTPDICYRSKVALSAKSNDNDVAPLRYGEPQVIPCDIGHNAILQEYAANLLQVCQETPAETPTPADTIRKWGLSEFINPPVNIELNIALPSVDLGSLFDSSDQPKVPEIGQNSSDSGEGDDLAELIAEAAVDCPPTCTKRDKPWGGPWSLSDAVNGVYCID